MRPALLSGSDFEKDYPGGYADCLAFSSAGPDPAVQARKVERAEFFRNLTGKKMGGVLVAYGDEGQVTGWVSFVEKAVARALLWPCRRQESADRRLVVACLLVDWAFRGRGVAGELLDGLEKLAKEWGYEAIEAPCRDEDTHDPDLTFQTPAPFLKRGYREVDRFHCDLMYPADFTIWELQVLQSGSQVR